MRRLLLALTVLSLIVPATAQMRGGGMRGGGMRGGGVAVRGGGMRAGTRIAAGRATVGTTVANGGIISLGVRPFPRSRFGHVGRFGHNRFRGNRAFFGNNCFGQFGFNGFCNGFGFNSGFGFGGWGLPWYIGDYDADYNGVPYAPDTREYQQSDNRDQQVQELLYQLRDQQRELDYLINNMQHGQEPEAAPQEQNAQPPARGNRPQSRPYGATAAPAPPQHEQPVTTLVFKDGHRLDVHNYVMAKGMLTVLDPGMRQHIQLSQLDIPATKKANEDKGVDFKAPTVTVSLMCNPADPNISCAPHRTRTQAEQALTP